MGHCANMNLHSEMSKEELLLFATELVEFWVRVVHLKKLMFFRIDVFTTVWPPPWRNGSFAP